MEDEDITDEDFEKLMFEAFKEFINETAEVEEKITVELMMEDGE